MFMEISLPAKLYLDNIERKISPPAVHKEKSLRMQLITTEPLNSSLT